MSKDVDWVAWPPEDNPKLIALRERTRSPLDTLSQYDVEEVIRNAINKLEEKRLLDPPKHKTCSKCASPSRDDPCEKCYELDRKQWEAKAKWDDLRPCLLCGTSLTKYIYCEACEDYIV